MENRHVFLIWAVLGTKFYNASGTPMAVARPEFESRNENRLN